jgi:hypothetical protein
VDGFTRLRLIIGVVSVILKKAAVQHERLLVLKLVFDVPLPLQTVLLPLFLFNNLAVSPFNFIQEFRTASLRHQTPLLGNFNRRLVLRVYRLDEAVEWSHLLVPPSVKTPSYIRHSLLSLTLSGETDSRLFSLNQR